MIGGGYAQTTLIQQFSQQCGTAAVGKRNEEQIQRSQAFFSAALIWRNMDWPK